MLSILIGVIWLLLFSALSSLPLAVVCFDRTSTGLFTLGMGAMAAGLFGLGVNGAISSIEVSFLPAAELAKKSLLGPNKPAQLSPTQTIRHIRTRFHVYVPVLTVGFFVCLLLAFHWQSYFPEHVDPKRIDIFNERQGFGKDQTDPRSRAATIRGNKEAFIATYGKPFKVAHGAQPPATDDLLFRNGDLVYEVSFWYGSAHNVLVWRWDDKPLEEQDIEKGLAAFQTAKNGFNKTRPTLKGKKSGRELGWQLLLKRSAAKLRILLNTFQ